VVEQVGAATYQGAGAQHLGFHGAEQRLHGREAFAQWRTPVETGGGVSRGLVYGPLGDADADGRGADFALRFAGEHDIEPPGGGPISRFGAPVVIKSR
jgi:hypothetical protein